MKKMGTIDWIAWILVTLGAVNWGLIGVANLNLVDSVLGTAPSLVQVIYILMGLGGLYFVWLALGKK